MSRRFPSLWILLALTFALCATASGTQTSARTHKGPLKLKHPGPRFGERERETINKYFHNPYSPLPQVMKNGGGDVPPGLRNQVAISNLLPPELQPKVLPFPPPLERRLTKLPKPWERAVIGPDVIIVNRKTQQVSDLMRSVLIPAHTGYN